MPSLVLTSISKVCVTLPHSPAIATFQIQPFALSSSSGFWICGVIPFIAAHFSDGCPADIADEAHFRNSGRVLRGFSGGEYTAGGRACEGSPAIVCYLGELLHALPRITEAEAPLAQ